MGLDQAMSNRRLSATTTNVKQHHHKQHHNNEHKPITDQLCKEIILQPMHTITTTHAYISTINPLHASVIVTLLNNVLPLYGTELHYYKRINSQTYNTSIQQYKQLHNHNTATKYASKPVLVLLGTELMWNNLDKSIKYELETNYNIKPYITEICNCVTVNITYQQYIDACKLWPIALPTPKPYKPRVFTHDEQNNCIRYMTLAIKQAIQAKQHNQLPRGCVIVDPRTNTIIQQCFDYRLTQNNSNMSNGIHTSHKRKMSNEIDNTYDQLKTNELQPTTHKYNKLSHCTIVCIDLVAQQQCIDEQHNPTPTTNTQQQQVTIQ